MNAPQITPDEQKLLDEADAAVASAKAARADAEALVARLEQEYDAELARNAEEQTKVDAKIKTLVRRMDAATLKFVHDTSV